IKVNGLHYRVVYPRLSSVFGVADQIDFREMTKVEKREQLIKIAVLDLSEAKGIFEPYEPIV
ncbi:MAG: hypothetical protein ACKOE6_01890, partial [Flammeovirgaceae bacterium]